MIKSGVAASSLPKCKYFDELAFLHKKSCNRPSESSLQLHSTFISPPPSPVYAKFQEKNKTNTVSQVSGLSCKKNEKLMRPRYISWSSCQILIMALRSYWPKTSLKISFIVEAWCPFSRCFHWKKKQLAKIRISQLLYELQSDEKYD